MAQYFLYTSRKINETAVSHKSSPKPLHPVIDQEGLIRVGGRLQQSAFRYQTMHPIILPPNVGFSELSNVASLPVIGCVELNPRLEQVIQGAACFDMDCTRPVGEREGWGWWLDSQRDAIQLPPSFVVA
jgi:hypothetical protein